MKETFDAVGRSVLKRDALDKALGRVQFLDDLELPGLLHAKLLRSRHTHARILNVDTSAVKGIPGVRAVITARDVPLNAFGVLLKDQPVLASDKVRYLGDPIAAVAAETIEEAEEAVERIRVDYEELPSVFNIEEAMKPDAVRVHEGSNVCSHRKIRLGDVEEGFRQSDLIVEDSFSTQKVEQCPLELQGSMARVDADGKLTVWSPMQSIPIVLNELTRVLQMPASRIRLIQSTVGGGFGGRIEMAMEPYAALLALKSGRPVKILRTREDEFTASTTRHSYRIDLKSGVKNDGKVIAREVRMIADTGAYMSFGDMQLTKAAIHVRGPYNIPNFKVDGYLVYTNNTVAGSMRGIGVVQAVAAEEVHMDHIAERLEFDPLELRLKNALKAGDITATGQVLHSVGLTETILTASDKAGWTTPPEQPSPTAAASTIRRGRGVACMQYPIGSTAVPNPSAAFLKVGGDGSVNIIAGALDLGQGLSTILSQIAAEELGVSVDSISVVSGNSDIVPYDAVTGASRTTYAAGNAVRLAAKEAKEMLFNVAAEKLNVSAEALESRGGVIRVRHAPQKYITIAEAATVAQQLRGMPVVAVASFNPPNTPIDPETGRGSPFPCYVYATQVADVEVDSETGLVKVLRVVAAHDVGKAINPTLLEVQIEGGVAMGLGQALTEELILREGRTLNPNFMNYLIPTAVDVPPVEVCIVEEAEPTGPFGAKGAAEPPNIPTTPAILNAIHDAVGVRIRDLPATPEKILKALKEKA